MPSSRRLAFAVLEGPLELVDWGMKTTGTADSRPALELVAKLLIKFDPEVVVIEDCSVDSCRRGSRIRELIELIATQVRDPLMLRRVPAIDLASRPKETKYQRALRLAAHFPEIHRHLPGPRKTWMSEDERIYIFDAVAFALQCYGPDPMSTNGDSSADAKERR